MTAVDNMTRRDWLILSVALVLTIALPLGDLLLSGVAGAVRYAAQDAFYYDTVARNIVRLGKVSYDQQYPTNGFHPLWQIAIAGVYLLCQVVGLSDETFLVISIVVNILLMAGAVLLAGRALIAAKGKLSAWFSVIPIGAYGLFMAPFWYYCLRHGYVANAIEGPPQMYGTLFSFMNGMESSVAIFMFAVVVLRFSRREPGNPLVDGLLLALLTLARLDVIFISAGLLAWLMFSEGALVSTKNVKRAIGFAVPILAYVLINRWYAGSFMPISGASKTSFPHPIGFNRREALLMFKEHIISADGFFRFWRTVQTLVPAFFALIFLPFLAARWSNPFSTSRKAFVRNSDRLDQILAVSAVGVFLLASYNFFFVGNWAQGHWYYAVSIFWMSLATLSLVSRLQLNWAPGTAITVIASIIVTVSVFFYLFRQPECHMAEAQLLARAPQIRAHYSDKVPKMLEYDDGVISFIVGFPCMNAMGLALDREAYQALKQGQLPQLAQLAYERGFDHVAVFSYNPLDLSLATPEQIAAFLPSLNLGDEHVTLEYALPGTRFGIFRVDRN